jgi:trimeric autotransporter adhesin
MKTKLSFKRSLTFFLILAFSKVNAQWISNPPYLYNTTQSIGIGTSTPGHLLDISGGNLNISTGRIKFAGSDFLWKTSSCTFLGDRAGLNAVTSNSVTCLGAYSGAGVNTYTVNSSEGGVFIGEHAGYSIHDGDYNTFTGFQSGYSTVDGAENCFYGKYSGYSNASTNSNCGFGVRALYNNTASLNCAYGTNALYNNSSGTPNTAVGHYSAQGNTTGTNNNAFGYQSLYTNSTGNYNSAFGDNALFNSTVSGSSAFGYNALTALTSGTGNQGFGYSVMPACTTGNYNHAFGYEALKSITSSSYHSAFGYQSMYSSTSAVASSSFGYKSMYATTTGSNNSAFGYLALTSNTTGGTNCAFGHATLTSCVGAGSNSGFGYEALFNATSEYNSAVGYKALFATTLGARNTGMGWDAGITNTTGYNNSFFGNLADASTSALFNATALGNGATVNASDKVRVGNAIVTVIEGQVNWSSTSDARFKTDVTENVKGLDFIKRLRPVSYKFDAQKYTDFLTKGMIDSARTEHLSQDFSASSNVIHVGLIAQEVEQAAAQSLFVNDIVHAPADSTDNYSIAYGALVVPLIKAVQEQQAIIDSLKTSTKKQDSINNALQQQINQILNTCCNQPGSGNRTTQNIDNNAGKGTSTTDVELTDKNIIVLNQNVPNPFAEQTTITYNIPQQFQFAQLLFYDVNGRIIKAVDVKQTGRGQLNVFANDLSNGIYSYTLVIDGNIIETKKMVKQN